MRSKRTYNYSILCTAINVVQWERNKDFLFFKYKTFASERSPWQQHGVNNGVRLPNDYTYTKLGKVLPVASKDVRHYITTIYYS